ncbi:MAG: hypothetical protein RMX68_005585 [Aulosira sp. ZfuVER01]|nr:hypothetical protein [Aulosira sp. ZfuVER01]MDZ8002466.1 hypothetical protein [Aulosira sp. DedVER01a]MDZ8056129.1 hypothetical protein [Aulosira sp. ZfuCHP01]
MTMQISAIATIRDITHGQAKDFFTLNARQIACLCYNQKSVSA